METLDGVLDPCRLDIAFTYFSSVSLLNVVPAPVFMLSISESLFGISGQTVYRAHIARGMSRAS
jgi:hypothetical protein